MTVETVTTEEESPRIDTGLIRELIRKHAEKIYIPSSVYRLQFGKDLTFKKAAGVVPYLKKLGIQAVYCSPYFQTTPGSSHGYNIIDPNKVNEEIGSPEDFEEFCGALKEHGLDHIVDVVPNHMGIKGPNKLWLDVLENGPSSIYAKYFDINWDPDKRELNDKVLIPVLGDAYGRVLENGELKLDFTGREFICRYWETVLPINPKTYPLILGHGAEELSQKMGEQNTELLEYLSVITAFRNLPGRSERDIAKIHERNREKEIAKTRLSSLLENSPVLKEFVESRVRAFNGTPGKPESFDLIHSLLNEQPYRVAYWRVASEEINYRRFFDINDLAALRIELDEVFEYHHQFVFDLIKTGKLQGLRIDHPDGLYDPPTYFANLQKRFLWNAVLSGLKERGLSAADDGKFLAPYREAFDVILREPGFAEAKPLYVVIEKILDLEEKIPEAWKVHGTVGYESINMLNGLFVAGEKEKEFTALYDKFIGHTIDIDQLVYDKKKFFALIHMSSEINNLGGKLKQISEKHRHYRDFTRANLTLATREVIACFPVYRTYISPGDQEVSKRDQKYINAAVHAARRRTPALPGAVYDFLKEVLLLRLEKIVTSEADKEFCRDFVLRFQQLTGPIMAKGLEDTAFYVFNRLLSLNEVGGDPTRFGCRQEDFHRFNREILAKRPGNFSPGSTHDTKRSEDIRMRLDVLSEIPGEWEESIFKWSRMNEKYRTLLEQVLEPRRNTEYFIYQTLVGVWPDEGVPENAMPQFKERIWQYVEKALREAKIYTNWINPNMEYENNVKAFLEGILSDFSENGFIHDFLRFQKKISWYGKLNTISALTMRLGSPGVVDIYQGSELWDYSLVDPDNRRPVDFQDRIRLLDSIEDEKEKGKEHFLQSLLEDAGRLPALKLHIIHEAIQLRRQKPDLFIKGEYVPLEVRGEKSRHVVAFLRKAGGVSLICASARFFTDLYAAGEVRGLKADPLLWKDTFIVLPEKLPEEWTDIFSGRKIQLEPLNGEVVIPCDAIFAALNASMLMTH